MQEMKGYNNNKKNIFSARKQMVPSIGGSRAKGDNGGRTCRSPLQDAEAWRRDAGVGPNNYLEKLERGSEC